MDESLVFQLARRNNFDTGLASEVHFISQSTVSFEDVCHH